MRLMHYQGQQAYKLKNAIRIFAVVLVMTGLGLLLPATPTKAAQIADDTAPIVFQSDMQTLYDALMEVRTGQYVLFGNLAVPPISQTMTPNVAKIKADLDGGIGPHMPVDEFLQRIMDATGGNEPWASTYLPNYKINPNAVDADRMQNPSITLNLLNNVLSGSAQAAVSLTNLQLNIPYAFLEPCPTCVPPTDYANGGASDPFPTPATNAGYLYTRAARLASFMMAGSGGAALLTLKAAIQSNQQALNVLTVISSADTDSNWPNSGQPYPTYCDVGAIAKNRLNRFAIYIHGGNAGLANYLDNNYGSPYNAPSYFAAIIDGAIAQPGTQRTLMNRVFADSYPEVDPGIGFYGLGHYGVYTYYWDQSDELNNNDLVPPFLPNTGVGCLNPLASQWAFNAVLPDTGSAFTPPTTQPPTTVFQELELPDPTNDNFNGDDDPVAGNDLQDPFIADNEPTPPDEDLDSCRDKRDQDSTHPLTDNFNEEPCTWTRDNQNAGFAQEHQAGWYFMDYLANWWEKEYLPSLKDMTAQLTAQISDQTMKLGAAKDAQNLQKTARAIQKQEVEIKKAVQPSEGACVVGSFNSLSSTTTRASNALAKGMTSDAGKVIGGGPTVGGDPNPEAPADAPNPRGKQAHFIQRLNDYCSYANDSDGNNGNDFCTNVPEDASVNNQANPDGTQTTTPTPEIGMVENGDIDIEGFLLQDTILLSDTKNRALASAMLANLVQPYAEDTPDEAILNLTGTQENILDMQHIKALKKIAAEVVGSMFSRRAAVPLPPAYLRTSNTGNDTSGAIDLGGCGGTNPDGTAQPACPATTPGSTGSFEQLLAKIRQREASGNYQARNVQGYMGGYQMGEQALIEAGAIKNISNNSEQNRVSYAISPASPPIPAPYTAGNTWVVQGKWRPSSKVPYATYNLRRTNYVWLPSTGITTNAQFLSNPALQDALYKKYLRALWLQVRAKGIDSYIGKTERGVTMTTSGILIGAHLIGPGGVRSFLSGKSPGTDANGTTALSYIKLFNGYDVSSITGNSYIAPTPPVTLTGDLSTIPNTDDVETPPDEGTEVNIAKMIRGIREQAGVPSEAINDAPSYNEIMLAMTKERFFSPKYFTNLAQDLTKIKQEQASVNAYITIQMQDIYKVQEQINALLAARASLKLGSTALSDHEDLMRVREEMYEP